MSNLFNLYLSPWDCKDKKENEVVVSADVVRLLKPYHYDSIRFLYTCFRSNLGGAILNQNDGMNFPLQIAAFLNGLQCVDDGSILVLADSDNFGYWYYHLSEHSKRNVKLDIDYSDNSCITLLSLYDESLFKTLDHNYSIVIIDNFEKVAKKIVIKKLTGQFKIGLTHRNFVKFPDQKLQWSMLRWSNSKHFGTFKSFCEMDNEYYEKLNEPFSQFWQRRTWDFYDDFQKETEEEIQNYREIVKKWLVDHNFSFSSKVEKNIKKKKKAPKRKSSEKESNKVKIATALNTVEIKNVKDDMELKGIVNDTADTESNKRNCEIKESNVFSEDYYIKHENTINDTSDVNVLQSNCISYVENLSNNSVIAEDTTTKKCKPELDESHNSDCILSFLFESSSGELNLKENTASTSKGCTDEEIISSILFQNNSDDCKSDVNFKRSSPETCNFYSKEKILSELFD